jgi:SAM-dependent methyltransferase
MPGREVSRRDLLRGRFGRPASPPPSTGVRPATPWAPGPLLRALEPLAATVCDVAALRPGEVVLDVGTGDGNVAMEAVGRGAVLEACDPSPAMLAAARARAGDVIAFQAAGAEALPYGDESFDVVLSVLGAALAPQPRRTGRELLRVLRPGGRLVVAAPAPRSLLARAHRMAGADEALSPARWSREEDVATFLAAAETELRAHPLRLTFASLDAAWEACAGPFGIPAARRDAFEVHVAERSPGAGAIGMQDPWQLVVARKGGLY